MEFTDEYIQQQKEIFLDRFFTAEIKRFPGKEGKDRQFVEVRFIPARKELKRSIYNLYNNYRLGMEWDDYISNVMATVTNAVINYVPKNKKFDWSTLNDLESVSNLTLNKYVMRVYRSEMILAAQKEEGQKQTTTRVNKKPVNTIVDFPLNSTDITIKTDDGGLQPAIQSISNNDKFGYQHVLYHPNYFLRWYKENQGRLLSKSQKEFMKIMPKFFHEEGSSYTKKFTDDETQPFTCKARRERMRRLRIKIEELYEDELPETQKITMLHMKKQADLHLLNELIHIVYNAEYDHVSDLNSNVCNWLYKHLNNDSNDVLSNLLHDNLTVGELKHLNRSLHNDYLICNKLIYKIVSLVEWKIEQLHNFDTSVKTERLVSNQRWPKEKRKAYDDNLREFKNQPVKVYDFNTGKLLRQEKYVPERKNYIVQTLDTYGNRHEEVDNNIS